MSLQKPKGLLRAVITPRNSPWSQGSFQPPSLRCEETDDQRCEMSAQHWLISWEQSPDEKSRVFFFFFSYHVLHVLLI